ncbi:hypothetical protein D3C71_1515740 [compost metagenome]
MSAPESHTTADAALSSLMGAVMGSPEYSRLVATSSSAQGGIGQHDLCTSAGGRAYVAEYFVKRLGRHDFTRYISDNLAADFACTLARHLASRPPLDTGDALDAARYRWMRDIARDEQCQEDGAIYARRVQFTSGVMTGSRVLTEDDLDTAIDAAIAQQSQRKEA